MNQPNPAIVAQDAVRRLPRWALLLLCVFTVVNISLLVLRRQNVRHAHFRTPRILPWIGAATCAFLAGPWARSAAQMDQYKVAGWLLGIGVVLWAVTYVWNRSTRHHTPGDMSHIEEMAEHHGDSTRN